MPKALTIGNGNLLACFDKFGQVRDLYFPYVGLENHIGGAYAHRVGVWVDGKMRWFSHPSWKIRVLSEDDSLSGVTTAVNEELGIVVRFLDVVYNEKDILLRRVTVESLFGDRKEVKLYFGHEFEIYESRRGDTSYFEPMRHAVVHYNGRRVFWASGLHEGKSFDDYTTGIFKIEGKEGSYKDAEDGVLSQNPIEHGLTDSVIGFYFSIAKGEKKEVYYWLAVSETIKDAAMLHDYILKKTPEHLIRTTRDFWRAWVNKYRFNLSPLGIDVEKLFKKSLFTIRAHTDNRGAIIASGDSDMMQDGRDTYSYMWPRDGAFSVMALDMAGDTNISRRFFDFCNKVITDDGYFMHKYRPDESLGSSWHPWVRNGRVQLPIQEDETALVIYALWKHYRIAKDLEFIESIYNSLIKRAADFMVSYRDEYTGLPGPSYDLWEEKFGISTFSSSAVYAALLAAKEFANILGKKEDAVKYRNAAKEIRNAILTYLYDPENGYFYKMLSFKNSDELEYDETMDMSSIYGIYAFGVLDVDDVRVEKSIAQVHRRLMCAGSVRGVARYEGDQFHRRDPSTPGNPWFITTLWLAQYHIQKAKNKNELESAGEWINWAVYNALPSGVLSEQLDPRTGAQISAAPLTWSHAEFVATVVQYIDKLQDFGECDRCNPLKIQ